MSHIDSSSVRSSFALFEKIEEKMETGPEAVVYLSNEEYKRIGEAVHEQLQNDRRDLTTDVTPLGQNRVRLYVVKH